VKLPAEWGSQQGDQCPRMVLCSHHICSGRRTANSSANDRGCVSSCRPSSSWRRPSSPWPSDIRGGVDRAGHLTRFGCFRFREPSPKVCPPCPSASKPRPAATSSTSAATEDAMSSASVFRLAASGSSQPRSAKRPSRLSRNPSPARSRRASAELEQSGTRRLSSIKASAALRESRRIRSNSPTSTVIAPRSTSLQHLT